MSMFRQLPMSRRLTWRMAAALVLICGCARVALAADTPMRTAPGPQSLATSIDGVARCDVRVRSTVASDLRIGIQVQADDCDARAVALVGMIRKKLQAVVPMRQWHRIRSLALVGPSDGENRSDLEKAWRGSCQAKGMRLYRFFVAEYRRSRLVAEIRDLLYPATGPLLLSDVDDFYVVRKRTLHSIGTQGCASAFFSPTIRFKTGEKLPDERTRLR